jgi:hypothetical protein
MTPLARFRLAVALLSALGTSLASAQELRNDDEDITQTVARVSYIQGNVAYARGDDPDQWQSADQNVPMTLGDRVYTDDGSMELQLEGGGVIRLGSRTDLTALNLTDDIKQFAVKAGMSSFAIPSLGRNETFEVDTPNAAVTFEGPGRYRIDVDESGETRVSVRRGNATIAAGGGQVALSAGEAMTIDGTDAPRFEVVSLSGPDRWDLWVDSREDRLSRTRSHQYVSSDVVGAAELDEYGSWESLPEYGRVWRPLSVKVGWAPYRSGRWFWQDPWGWTWISTEPWGWAPYHYGRWVFSSARWYWVPVAPAVRAVRYSPALVAFVGGGPSFGVSASFGGGVVGWFPLAPRDPLVPWWGRRPAVNVNVTNITYVNRTYVTVVNQSTFVSGALVSTAVIKERSTIRQAMQAPVVVGAVPISPTVSSTRVSVRRESSASRPPAAVVSRSVVTRIAPPPAPPRFEQKLAVIRENGGVPVSSAVSSRIASANNPQPRAVIPVRPATSETGNVKLAPRNNSSGNAKRVESVTTTGQRPLARVEKPVANTPLEVPPASTRPEIVRPQDSKSAPDSKQQRVADDAPPPQSARPKPATARPQAVTPLPQRGKPDELNAPVKSEPPRQSRNKSNPVIQAPTRHAPPRPADSPRPELRPSPSNRSTGPEKKEKQQELKPRGGQKPRPTPRPTPRPSP